MHTSSMPSPCAPPAKRPGCAWPRGRSNARHPGLNWDGAGRGKWPHLHRPRSPPAPCAEALHAVCWAHSHALISGALAQAVRAHRAQPPCQRWARGARRAVRCGADAYAGSSGRMTCIGCERLAGSACRSRLAAARLACALTPGTRQRGRTAQPRPGRTRSAHQWTMTASAQLYARDAQPKPSGWAKPAIPCRRARVCAVTRRCRGDWRAAPLTECLAATDSGHLSKAQDPCGAERRALSTHSVMPCVAQPANPPSPSAPWT